MDSKLKIIAKNDKGSISQLNYMQWLELELGENDYRLKDNILGMRGKM